MTFRAVFIAVVIGTGLVVAGFLINRSRPRVETDQPSSALVRATGKCAECHTRQQHSVVHEYELSLHARKGINCLDCHQPAPGQEAADHHGFSISKSVTAANCRACHEPVYQQFLRSRHAAPAWAAVFGEPALNAEQVAFSEQYHPGACKRPPHPLVDLQGQEAGVTGCAACHSVGKPNADGTIGTCTACHTRHTSSVEIARLPTTCGQCHLGPDHAQLEIYNESKHGVMFAAQKDLLKLDTSPAKLTTRDMFVPTCATCHMSGLGGMKVTHDPGERLSWFLMEEVSTKRPHYAQAQAAMKEVCLQCHTRPRIDNLYAEAEKVVADANRKVSASADILAGLRRDGVLPAQPFAHPIDLMYLDLWHYDAVNAKHGAFMGGADFTQWHGQFAILKHGLEIQATADELRKAHANSNAAKANAPESK